MNITLSPEARTLVEDAVRRMSAAYDAEIGLVRWKSDGGPSVRASLYTALGLMILGTDEGQVSRICETVISLQLIAPPNCERTLFSMSSFFERKGGVK